jgi:hypothetical protein
MIRGSRIAIGLMASATVGACATSGGTDHETHWLACKNGGRCPSGYACEEGLCAPQSASDAGTHPSAPDGSTPSPDAPANITIPNPTGACKAPDNGARRGYSSPEPGSVWLPDCANPLRREYWRVYAVSADSAYVLPRPDGARELSVVCNASTHPLKALVERYRLCALASTAADVAVINDMRPADALTLTHFMHTQLLFEVTEGIPNAYLLPYPLPSDVLDACALHPGTNTSAMQADCELTQHFVDTGLETAPEYSQSASELARLLDELYGIGGCAGNESPRRVCVECGPADGCTNLQIRCVQNCREDRECGDGATCTQGFCPSGAALCG